MNFFDAMRKRYSHKEDFLPDAVSIDVLEEITQAGVMAPNGVNRQIVRFVILPNAESLAPIAQIAQHGGLSSAPAAIAVLTDATLTPADGFNFEKEDYSAAVTQMLLAATALGYASLWLDSPFFDAARERQAVQALGAPEHMRIWACLPVGKPRGPGSRREKLPFAARVFYGRFGQAKQ